ncbi:TonB-linked outer membrane protein, SusC/RagA family [bacterium A37T11]|nr:TonB-linked outer membrane protein, SusC/RagA family [bacterium A37T11]
MISNKKWLLCLLVLLGKGEVFARSFREPVKLQQLEVSGTVSDANGTLTGVSVYVKGLSGRGTTTDAKGHFRLVIPDKTVTLTFSMVGYVRKEVPLTDTNPLKVLLEADNSNLDEVVVVGYGQQKKRDVTGAISSISRADIEKRQAINIFDAMQGQASGVQIAQESGRPGAGSSMRIRGTATLQGGADPLYIVDGAQGVNIEGINPADIASIEILKDAASAAIYGARSANGVVIITTKKGIEGKPQINVNYLQSFSNLSHKIAQSNAALRRLYLYKRNGTAENSLDSLNPSFNADNDYQDLLTQTGVRNQVDLSVSGANKNLNYYSSLSYLKDKGIILNSYSDIARARFNMDYRPNDKFSIVNRIQLSYQKENRISDGNTLNQAIQRPPSFAVYLPDGTLAPVIGGRRNPVAEALLNKNEFDSYDGNIYTALSYEFIKGLRLTTDANVKVDYTHNLKFTPKLVSTSNINEGADLTDFNTYWQLQAYLNFHRTFTGDHDVTAVFGLAADKDYSRGSDLSGSNYVSETVLTLNSAQLLDQGGTYTSGTRNTSASAFGRVGYSYKGKYLFNSNFRMDGASRFGKDKRWGFFPSASLGWRFSEERFLKNSSGFLDDGKLRFSYGETGNDRIDNYAAIQRYVFGQYYYNGVSGVVQNSQLGNSLLSWEATKQFNLGIDLSFFKGRLTFVGDYYRKITDNLLYNAPLAYETGYSSVQVNVGSIQNKGFEFMLTGIPVRSKQFEWNISYNMSFNNNTVRKLYGGTSILSGSGKWLIEEGQKLGNFYGWKALGVYSYDVSNAYSENWDRLTPVDVSPDGKSAGGYTLDGKPYNGPVQQLYTQGNISKGGDVIWENERRDSVIDDNDRMILGNAQPKFVAGLANSFSYKSVSLSFDVYVSWGGKIYDKARYGLNTFGTTNVTPEPDAIIGAWNKQGDVTDWPIAKNNSMGNVRELNSNYIEDASFIRLRNLKVSYRLPLPLVTRIHLKGIGIYAYANNLLTWTNYKWFDPEISFNNALEMGVDNGRYPRKREFGLGLNVSF